MNYFLTELNFEGYIPKDHTNLRAAETWIKFLGAYHLNLFKTLNEDKKYTDSICWLIIPKGDEAVKYLTQNCLNLVEKLKTKFNKVHCIQEGESTFWHKYDVTTQTWIFLQFEEADKIYTQNKYDLKYLRGLHNNSKFGIIRSVMDDSILNTNNFKEKQNKTLLPGPFTTEYYGFTQTIVARHTECEIDIPPMGQSRMPKDSWGMAENVGVNYLPYMMWKEWMENMSQYKYAYFLVPSIGAGTFPLNCAYHGIPCVGDIRADTQKLLFPLLSIDHLDLEQAVYLTQKLKSDKIFYSEVSNYAREVYKNEFSKERFLEIIKLDY
tara:strand:+ start:10119 stop:11087 length:969 start_codon:yes stop_codon:yes gene_type:complete